MIDQAKAYWINNPIFLKFKEYFSIKYFSRIRVLKKIYVNERIVEIPFALQAISKLSQNSEVLDIGCAESILPLYLSYLGVKVTGLDCRDYPYTAPNLKFSKGNILQLPFSDCSFDAVTCISTVEHIGIGFYDDPLQNEEPDAKAICEIKRILRPGGYLVLSVPYGIRSVNSQQRIYDYKGLQCLMKDFKIILQKYYIDIVLQKSICNMWSEISKEKADLVDCREKVQCVTCLVATLK